MCQPKPFPRCSGHATKALRKATQSGNPEAIKQATDDFLRTPRGIEKLKARGDLDLARKYELERNAMKEAGRASVEVLRAIESENLGAIWKSGTEYHERSQTVIKQLRQRGNTELAQQQEIAMEEMSDRIRESSDRLLSEARTLARSSESDQASQRGLLSIDDEETHRLLAENVYSSPEVLNELVRMYETEDLDSIHISLGGNPSMSSEALDSLAKRTISPEAIARYNNSSYPTSVAREVARNPNTSTDSLTLLAVAPEGVKVSWGRVSSQVARNENASAESLDQIASEIINGTAWRENQELPSLEIYGERAHVGHSERLAISRHLNTSSETTARLKASADFTSLNDVTDVAEWDARYAEVWQKLESLGHDFPSE